jgi:hypothetical protein
MSNTIHPAHDAGATHESPIAVNPAQGEGNKPHSPIAVGPAVSLSLSNTKSAEAAPAKANDAAEGDQDGDGH